MVPAELWMLALFVVCLVMSAFFSSSETAFIALPRARLLHLVDIGHSRAELVSRLLRQPERLLATVLLSNNLVNTAAAALGTAIAIDLINDPTIALLVSTLGVTALLLVFSETLPKTVAWKRPELVAFAFSRPLAWVQWILFPAIQVLHLMTALFAKMVGISSPISRNQEEEIRTMIRAGVQTGEVEASEAALLEKVFRFGDRQVREIMTPRPEIVWIEKGTSLKGFLNLYSEHSHTRFPVYEGTMENVIGVLSNKDVIVAMAKGHVALEDSVTDLLRPAYFVPETKPVNSTFSELQQEGHGLVLTVNEFGGIAGLASLKQLLEVIVGTVHDEDSDVDEGYTSVDEDTYQVDASNGVAEINEKLNLDIPEGDYQTLAGFVLDRLGYIPEKGEILEHGSLKLTVQKMDGVRIDQVEIEKVALQEAEAQE